MSENQTGPCAKQVVTAILIAANGERFVGTNYCENPQEVCPRNLRNYARGEGYHLCKEICKQVGHAEEVAIAEAGAKANGGVIYVEGHDEVYSDTGTGACHNCVLLARNAGASIVVGPPPEAKAEVAEDPDDITWEELVEPPEATLDYVQERMEAIDNAANSLDALVDAVTALRAMNKNLCDVLLFLVEDSSTGEQRVNARESAKLLLRDCGHPRYQEFVHPSEKRQIVQVMN